MVWGLCYELWVERCRSVVIFFAIGKYNGPREDRQDGDYADRAAASDEAPGHSLALFPQHPWRNFRRVPVGRVGGHPARGGHVGREPVAGSGSAQVPAGAPVTARALGYLAEEGGDAPLPEGIPDLDQHPMRVWEIRIALRNAGNIDPMDIHQYVANGGYQALHKALTGLTREETLEEVKTSGLRGRGGAAFPTAVKWSSLAGNPAPEKYVLCNC